MNRSYVTTGIGILLWDLPTMPKYLSYVVPIGIARLALYISPESFLPIADDGSYRRKFNNDQGNLSLEGLQQKGC